MIIYYLKLIFVFFVTAVFTIIALFSMMLINQKTFHKLARIWSFILLKIVGINLEIVNKTQLNKDKSYIYIANHSSLFDIPVLLYGLNDNARIMYKEELEKIPIFGYGLKKSPFISIIRSDPRNAMEGIEKAALSIKEGDSVIIFPEGTRSEDGQLGEFKRGAFLLASKSQKHIVPVTVVGSSKILPKGKKKFQRGIVKVIIDEPIDNSSDSKQSQIKLMNETRNLIFQNLNNYGSI